MRPIRFSIHARRQAARRIIADEVILEIGRFPEQVVPVRTGREVRQSLWTDSTTGRRYLIRVFVDVDRDADVVVTVYRTTKFRKYGRIG